MKYEAILAFSQDHSVKRMCEVLGLDARNYYRWKSYQKNRKDREIEYQKLVARIEKVFESSDRTYGYRAISKELEAQGETISIYKIRKIMRENGFYPETRTKYRPYRNGKTDGRYKPNIVRQQFHQDAPNQVWAGDITYIRTNVGWVYLAVVIDLFNREVIGYSISKKINAELARNALGNAIAHYGVSDGLIFHSDRGSQYSSKSYEKMLEQNRITGSMSRPGCPYDNSCVESFFATLKKERIYRKNYDTIDDVRIDLFQYIELFYNRRRRHSALGYLSPVMYRQLYDAGEVA